MANATKMKLKEDILDVLRNSDERLRSFRNRIENKYVIIFVGNTRNGKSTLVNYITGVPLVAFQDKNNYYKIEHQNGPNMGATIGHGTLSHTTIPTIIEMRGRPDTLIIDAPGFDDNRGALQEITNALYINQIKYAKGVRFVLVSDINNIINDNINYFLSFIETVHTIMPDFLKLKDAVSIIFTKDWKQYNQEEIVKLLRIKILDVKGLRCKKDLIKHFVERSDLIGLFKMPTSAGALTEEINVNVDGAIFKSLPINLNTSDIKFGISKSARIVLLETYMDFFDIVLSLKETFDDFRTSALEKLNCLNKSNLLLLSDEQLRNPRGADQIIQEFLFEIGCVDLASTMQIPDSLKSLFVEDVGRVINAIEGIGVEVPNKLDLRRNLDKIEDIRRKLEYIDCIEKVVEKNNKSRSILTCYKESTQIFHREIKDIHNSINKEVEVRDSLVTKLASIPDIENRLLEINDTYLCASTKSELLKMQHNLQFYVAAANKIVTDISERPTVKHQRVQEIHRVTPVSSNIENKIRVIEQHIEKRNNEVLCKYIPQSMQGIFGTFIFCAGFASFTLIKSLDETTQLQVVAGSFLLFAAFSWKSIYVRTALSRVQRRYQQKRLFTSRTKLDNCWKDLIHDDLGRGFFRR